MAIKKPGPAHALYDGNPPASQGLEGGATSPKAKILLIDDDSRNLIAISSILEDLAEVVTASSGEEGLRALLDDEFAVILLDVIMPGIDGYETAELIRRREKSKHIPIVFLSAINKDATHLMQGYAMGAVDYVFKPVEPLILRSKVAVFVDLFSMNTEIRKNAVNKQRLLDENLRIHSERLTAEKELRVAEQRQAAIIKALPIVLYTEEAGAETRRRKFVGGNVKSVLGYEDDSSLTLDAWLENVHPEDRTRVRKELKERSRSGGIDVEYRWRNGDGVYRCFLDQAVKLLEDADGPAKYAGTLLDLTERKLLEDQLFQAQKMDSIGKLTGGIAHDFNNLLAAVLGGIGQIERRSVLTEDAQKILAMTRHAAEQGAELIKRLLAFSRRQQLQPAAVDIHNLAQNLNELFEHTLGGLVRLEWRFDENLWRAYADETQLELAVLNIVLNARDAMPGGGVITFSCANRTGGAEVNLPERDYVVLSIEDEGCGIAEEILEKVVEPFFTTKGVGKGTGLGLSMVYGFARQSGGALKIHSTVKEGTRVDIWLPRAVKTASRPKKDKSLPEPPAVGSLRVILVDDHEGVRETTAGMLKDIGHEVFVMTDGDAALGAFGGEPDKFDLIVTDYAMPLKSGGELIKEMRKVRPRFPAVIISGYADANAIITKPDEVVILEKPFTPAQLDRAVRACAGVRQPSNGPAQSAYGETVR